MHSQPNCARTLRRAHDLVSFFAVIPERVRWGRQSTRFGRRGFVFYPLFSACNSVFLVCLWLQGFGACNYRRASHLRILKMPQVVLKLLASQAVETKMPTKDNNCLLYSLLYGGAVGGSNESEASISVLREEIATAVASNRNSDLNGKTLEAWVAATSGTDLDAWVASFVAGGAMCCQLVLHIWPIIRGEAVWLWQPCHGGFEHYPVCRFGGPMVKTVPDPNPNPNPNPNPHLHPHPHPNPNPNPNPNPSPNPNLSPNPKPHPNPNPLTLIPILTPTRCATSSTGRLSCITTRCKCWFGWGHPSAPLCRVRRSAERHGRSSSSGWGHPSAPLCRVRRSAERHGRSSSSSRAVILRGGSCRHRWPATATRRSRQRPTHALPCPIYDGCRPPFIVTCLSLAPADCAIHRWQRQPSRRQRSRPPCLWPHASGCPRRRKVQWTAGASRRSTGWWRQAR
jgi:hypothetical protein